jgi:pimeloyl-ACP methyl ester carboxylesterase
MPAHAADGVTVYVPGATGGQWQWGIPGRDNPALMAGDGHASVVLDRLGHGTSGRPPGNDMCAGSEADVLHQIVGALRSGDYSAGVAFSRVAAAGHSLGSAVVQVEAESYHDVDAIVLTGWGSTAVAAASPEFIARIGSRVVVSCASDEDGWIDQWPSPAAEAGDLFHDPDAEVLDAVEDAVEPESCGSLESIGAIFIAGGDAAQMATIDAEVLVINGEHDMAFDPAVTHVQQYRYPSSPDADAVVVPDAGHTFMIERPETAAVFRTVVGTWLAYRGF